MYFEFKKIVLLCRDEFVFFFSVFLGFIFIGTVGAETNPCKSSEFFVQVYANTELKGPPMEIGNYCQAPNFGKKIDMDWKLRGPNVIVGNLNAGGGGCPNCEAVFEPDFRERRDEFSVRWEGKFPFDDGSYTFDVTSDDGIRVWVDDNLVIDDWSIHAQRGRTAEVELEELEESESAPDGGYVRVVTNVHSVKVEYFEQDRGAIAQVDWYPTPKKVKQ